MTRQLFWFSFWMLSAALAIASVNARAAAAPLPSRPTPGQYELDLKVGGFKRMAHVRIPTGYRPGDKPPLVLVLHGAGGDGPNSLDKQGWTAKADREGFIVVAPDGLPLLPRLPANFRANPRLWNSGDLNPRSPRAAADDVAFIRQLLDELRTRIPYDERQVFCAGHSNGGRMTFRLASELSERFTAVAVVAGLLVVQNPKPEKPLPTLYILGTKDPFMPLRGGDVELPWATIHNPPIADNLAKWADAIGCETTPKTRSDQNLVRTVEYPSKSHGPTLTALYLEGHGHQWPGGQANLPESVVGPVTSKLSATDAIWDFFVAQAAQAK
jgi:polyhydroxybutyrate depolymerase